MLHGYGAIPTSTLPVLPVLLFFPGVLFILVYFFL